MQSLKRTAKRLVKAALGKDFFPKVEETCRTERLGSGYGGWEIAVDSLSKAAVVYSFGVGEDASFDIALIDRYGLTVHAFDPTPKSIQWVHRQNFPPNFVLHEYGLADFDGEVTFNSPKNQDHVSHTMLDRPSGNATIQVPVKTLTTIMQELDHDHIDLLKMDIEGAEYQVIEDLVKSTIRPAQLLIEFHHRFPEVGIKKTQDSLALLRGIGYRLFAVSDIGEEFSFIYKPDA